ncbi:MAG: hypothetical protein GWN58_10600 [Anaerolineae bacterium]|nr:hypothetical protein [Anaerolineae bacterium]
MKTARFEVLSQEEVERIHAASMEVLSTVGIKVEWKPARDRFREAGADVDDEGARVRIPEKLVRWAADQAPEQFALHGTTPADGTTPLRLDIGGDNVCFAGLGTPTHIIDIDTGQRRPCTMDDVVRHIQLINGCQHIHNSQMDVWPNDIPMTTIHSERGHLGLGAPQPQALRHGLLRLPAHPGHDAHDGHRLRRQGRDAPPPCLFRHLLCGQPPGDAPDAVGGAVHLRRLWPATGHVARGHRRGDGARHPGRAAGPAERQYPGPRDAGPDL